MLKNYKNSQLNSVKCLKETNFLNKPAANLFM